MKPLVGLLLAYLFLDKSFSAISSKKHSFDKLIRKEVFPSLEESLRHLLTQKTTERSKRLSFFLRPPR
jgi:hypothetical protein